MGFGWRKDAIEGSMSFTEAPRSFLGGDGVNAVLWWWIGGGVKLAEHVREAVVFWSLGQRASEKRRGN